jgi:hypothetical protein
MAQPAPIVPWGQDIWWEGHRASVTKAPGLGMVRMLGGNMAAWAPKLTRPGSTYKKRWKTTIYSGFSHETWYFSIVVCMFTRGYHWGSMFNLGGFNLGGVISKYRNIVWVWWDQNGLSPMKNGDDAKSRFLWPFRWKTLETKLHIDTHRKQWDFWLISFYLFLDKPWLRFLEAKENHIEHNIIDLFHGDALSFLRSSWSKPWNKCILSLWLL